MIVAKRILIAGRVQGVGFRFFAEAQAAVEGVHGYVSNLPDGRVEVLVEAGAASWSRRGACGVVRRRSGTSVRARDGVLDQVSARKGLEWTL